jgi:hypothetical protein
MTLSITEMRDKVSETAKDLFEGSVSPTLRDGYHDYYEKNIFGTGYTQTNPLKEADRLAISETLRAHPLREFLAKSGTTGIAGAAYLVPTKIHQVIYDSACELDIVDWASIAVIPAEQIPGTTLKVDIAVDDSYQPQLFSSGGNMPVETIKTTQATLDFSDTFGVSPRVTNDLIEDSQFDVMEMHLRNAGRELGEYATNLALGVLKLAADGDGTLNSGVSGDADETKWAGATTEDIQDALIANAIDGYHSNRMVMSLGAMLDSVYDTVPNYSEPWIGKILANGWPSRIGPLEVRYSEVNTLTNDKVGTNLVTIVFSKEFSLLSGRKRWLRIENYSDPIRDMVGSAITCRQDSVTIYNDSVFTITES